MRTEEGHGHGPGCNLGVPYAYKTFPHLVLSQHGSSWVCSEYDTSSIAGFEWQEAQGSSLG